MVTFSRELFSISNLQCRPPRRSTGISWQSPWGRRRSAVDIGIKKETLSDEYFHQVTDLAGIGDVLGKRLSGKGFDKVNIGNGDKFELI